MRYILSLIIAFSFTFVQAEQQEGFSSGWNTRALGQALIQFGILQDQIYDLDPIIERGNHREVQRAVYELRSDIDNFSHQMKRLAAPELHDEIDQVTRMADQHLASIQSQVSEDNVEAAQQEYRALKQNWGQLDDYVASRATDILADKQQVKGWVNWFLDWWYGGD